MTSVIRALKASRISKSSDDSTSLVRQDNAENALIDGRGWKVAGAAVDDGVSASKVAPFDRPELGPWLTDPVLINSYDVIVWWRLDRAVRSMTDLHLLAGWAKKHGKKLVFCVGPGGGELEFDMSSPLGMLLMTVLAFAAEMEAHAIKERVQSSHDYLATQPRWAAGAAPYGYKTVDRIVNGEAVGKTLSIVPEEAKVLREIVDMVIGGEPLVAVARTLNDLHIPAPCADFDFKRSTEPVWRGASIALMLRSVRLMGHKEAKGKPVFTATGEPIIMADPIVDPVVFRKLQHALDVRKGNSRVRNTAPFLGVVFCGVCKGPAYRQTQSVDKRDGYVRPANYRCCGKRNLGIKACTGVQAYEIDLTERISSAFLENIGPIDRPEKTFIPGADYTAELENIEHALDNLQAESDAGLVRDREKYINRLTALTTRQEKLAALPARPDRWEERPSGKTWGDWWEESDVPARRELLLAASFRVWLLPGGNSVAYWPGESGLSLKEFVASLEA